MFAYESHEAALPQPFGKRSLATAEWRRGEVLVMKTNSSTTCTTPNPFVAQHQAAVIGELHGWDRLRLQGTLPPLYCPEIMHSYLWKEQVLYKNFAKHTKEITQRMRTEIEGAALRRQRPVIYLRSAQESKEEKARALATAEGIDSGVICVFSALETADAWEAHGNHATRKLELQLRPKRAIHLYVYLMHAVLGFMHVRFQMYFPFLVQMCLNGREWLARQMIQAGLGFTRERNCFPWLENPAAAQALMDAQGETHWPDLCNGLVEELNPVAADVRAPMGLQYYWTTPETEYASDVMFRDRAALAACYPQLIHHGITSFGCEKVLRFYKPGSHGSAEEIKSRLQTREEGVCLKHWLGGNSIKMYDKGSVLRVETTINDPGAFCVLRPPTGQPEAPKKRRKLRRTTADLHRRAEVSHAATGRYFEALSVVEGHTPLAKEAAQVCRRLRRGTRRYRALNPLGAADARLLQTVNDARWVVDGFTNATLRAVLYSPARTAAAAKRQAGQTTRLIRLLRAHGLVRKIGKAHRYHVTSRGRRIITALLAARRADLDQLTKLAA